MFVNFNNRILPMGLGYPMPLYFFMGPDRKITPEQLKANLRRIVDGYVSAAVNNNKNNTGNDHKDNNELNPIVKEAVQTAINELLTEIVDSKIKISPTSSTASVGVGTTPDARPATTSKVFNLGSYVNDMNAEFNQVINAAIPL